MIATCNNPGTLVLVELDYNLFFRVKIVVAIAADGSLVLVTVPQRERGFPNRPANHLKLRGRELDEVNDPGIGDGEPGHGFLGEHQSGAARVQIEIDLRVQDAVYQPQRVRAGDMARQLAAQDVVVDGPEVPVKGMPSCVRKTDRLPDHQALLSVAPG